MTKTMPVTQRVVYVASDGTSHETEQEARDHELRLDLAPRIDDFLRRNAVGSTVRRNKVADLVLEFSLELLSPPVPLPPYREESDDE